MRIRRTAMFAAGLLAAVTALAQTPAAPESPAAPASKLSYTDDYRIQVNHNAGSDGTIAFRITTQEGGTVHEVSVSIKKGTGENAVARAIKEALKAQLGTKNFHIEGDDGEAVIIEGRHGKRYALELVGNSVSGVSVKIEHD